RESGSRCSPSAAAEGSGAAFAPSTSSNVTRPPGPVPVTRAMSTPSSCARLRAAGELRTRSPSDDEDDKEEDPSDSASEDARTPGSLGARASSRAAEGSPPPEAGIPPRGEGFGG